MPKNSFTLYYDLPSLCSQMVRYTWALGNEKDDENTLDLKRINIMREEQLDERFLLNVNWKGQVPVLVPNDDPKSPMPESEAITDLFMSLYPQLKGPARYQADIEKMIRDIHKINFYALSFDDKPKVTFGFQKNMKTRLQDPAISADYKAALERKLALWQKENIDCLEAPSYKENLEFASDVLIRLGKIAEEHCIAPRSWLYGEVATALDAHLVVLLARLDDVGKMHIVPHSLRGYYEWATKERTEWRTMMGGERTMPPKTDT